MRTTRGWLALGWLALGWPAACGWLCACGARSSLRSARQGSGGAGQSSAQGTGASGPASSGSTATPGPFTATGPGAQVSAVTAGPTGPPMDVCGAVCMSAAQCAQLPNCVGACESAGGACHAAQQDYLRCLAMNGFSGPNCAYVPACVGPLKGYLGCNFGPQSGPCAGGPDGSCSCDYGVQQHTFTTSCARGGDGNAHCKCAIDGMPFGACTTPDNGNVCVLTDSCCEPLFFVDR